MKRPDPEHFDKVFVHRGCPMCSELVEKLAGDKELSPTRIRDMVSGLRRVAKALHRPLEDVPADPQWLQPRLANIAPAALGISPKAWTNILSDARTAMAHYGIVKCRRNHIDDLSPQWRHLWAIVLASDNSTLSKSLGRFVHFLNRQGVAPRDVCDEHALTYREALKLNEISKSPAIAYRTAVSGWNRAVRRIPEWPRTTLSRPSRRKVIKLPAETFPSSFLNDLDRLLDRLRRPDPLDPNGWRNPRRPTTINLYRCHILRFASELIQTGVPACQIESLQVLIDPAMAERGLRNMLARHNNETGRGISQIAGLLRNISKILNAPEETQKRLASLARRLAVETQNGMTLKNRNRLRVLQDEDSLRKLLLLPEKIFARSSGKAKPHMSALAREDALAIAILLICPIRVKNLAEIHLERNLNRPGDGRVFLVFEDDEVKNHRHVEFELPPDVRRMIERHLSSRAPELCPSGTPWLFPRRDGCGPIDPNQLSSRLAKRIHRETGLEVNAHLFRHLAVMIWLDANPGSYEAARRLLGHAKLSHTLNLYSGMEARTATQAFARVVAEKKSRKL
jgi:integrase